MINMSCPYPILKVIIASSSAGFWVVFGLGLLWQFAVRGLCIPLSPSRDSDSGVNPFQECHKAEKWNFAVSPTVNALQ
jgi:hypothetical protein